MDPPTQRYADELLTIDCLKMVVSKICAVETTPEPWESSSEEFDASFERFMSACTNMTETTKLKWTADIRGTQQKFVENMDIAEKTAEVVQEILETYMLLVNASFLVDTTEGSYEYMNGIQFPGLWIRVLYKDDTSTKKYRNMLVGCRPTQFKCPAIQNDGWILMLWNTRWIINHLLKTHPNSLLSEYVLYSSMDDWCEDTMHIYIDIYQPATRVTESGDIDGLCARLLLSESVSTTPNYQISPPTLSKKGGPHLRTICDCIVRCVCVCMCGSLTSPGVRDLFWSWSIVSIYILWCVCNVVPFSYNTHRCHSHRWGRLTPHTVGTRGQCHASHPPFERTGSVTVCSGGSPGNVRLPHVSGRTVTCWGANTLLTCKSWCVSYR